MERLRTARRCTPSSSTNAETHVARSVRGQQLQFRASVGVRFYCAGVLNPSLDFPANATGGKRGSNNPELRHTLKYFHTVLLFSFLALYIALPHRLSQRGSADCDQLGRQVRASISLRNLGFVRWQAQLYCLTAFVARSMIRAGTAIGE